MRLPLFTAVLFLAALAAPTPAAARDTDEPSALDRMSETDGLGRADGVLGAAPSGVPADLAPPGCGTPGNPPCPPVDAPQVPVDGGLGLLAAAGATYAARRLRARRG